MINFASQNDFLLTKEEEAKLWLQDVILKDDLEVAARPQWARVISRVGMWVDETALRGALSDFAPHIEQLPAYMRDAGVDSEIIEHRQSAITQNYQQLIAL